jgi:hypothetical protein
MKIIHTIKEKVRFCIAAVIRRDGKWIKTNDEMPADLESVITYDSGGDGDDSSRINEGFFDGDKWFSVREDYDLINVTHWMPFPMPPKNRHVV